MIKLTKANIDELPLETLDRLIFPDIKQAPSLCCDAALVLGTDKPNEDRTPKAVECYKSSMCKKLVFSGGVYWDTEYGRLTEAEYMKRYAMDNGVPECDIILDNMARTTIENMLCGAIALHRAFTYISEVKKLMIITSDFHMRRSMLIAKALMPRFTELYAVPSGGGVTKRTWKDTDFGIRRVRAEAGFIKAMALHGMTPDIEL